MAKRLILETSFLIDREREITRDKPGPAQSFLRQRENSRFYITPVIAGEMAAGPVIRQQERWSELLAPFRVLPTTSLVSWKYGEIFSFLQRTGAMIGTNDLWIAAAGIAHRMAIVTANAGNFERVPGLEVIAYRE